MRRGHNCYQPVIPEQGTGPGTSESINVKTFQGFKTATIIQSAYYVTCTKLGPLHMFSLTELGGVEATYVSTDE